MLSNLVFAFMDPGEIIEWPIDNPLEIIAAAVYPVLLIAWLVFDRVTSVREQRKLQPEEDEHGN
ncbi:MAG TPA: hypothetical protein VJC05_02775 [Candidatus Andersenbacteria bacterium]|nr:hypothetical protein [Candidatus Andersenbacteria bacterium]